MWDFRKKTSIKYANCSQFSTTVFLQFTWDVLEVKWALLRRWPPKSVPWVWWVSSKHCSKIPKSAVSNLNSTIVAVCEHVFCFQSPKKVGDDIAKGTADWKGLKITVQLKIQNRQATISVVPSAAALVIKALKEPPRDRKKQKNSKIAKLEQLWRYSNSGVWLQLNTAATFPSMMLWTLPDKWGLDQWPRSSREQSRKFWVSPQQIFPALNNQDQDKLVLVRLVGC